MAPSSLFLKAAALVAVASNVGVSAVEYPYALDEVYQGPNFFDKFNFLTTDDPTNGFVDYKDRSTAETLDLIEVDGTQAYLRVDHKTNLTNVPTRGRASVRIESKK